MIENPWQLCTFFRDEKVERFVERITKSKFIFKFFIQPKGVLRVDFRPQENQEISVQLTVEECAEAVVRVLYRGRGDSFFSCRTIQRHMGNCSASTMEVKCICEDSARVHYWGKIDIPENISGVKVEQKNVNLILSESVYIQTEPAMDVRSRDVECLHGAAIGGIDAEILQYFSLRGIEESLAQELFIAGFLH
jgi:Fe-S cluster assembly scaffold protein SufB